MRAIRTFTQRGAGLIETLVGILIGMIVVAVIYNTILVAEGFRRATLGVSDAQTTGQLAQFLIGRELSNAGNGVMSANAIGPDFLAGCDDWQLRPIPALITDSGSPDVSDTLTTFYSNSTRIVHPVRVETGTPLATLPTDPITVVSPNGFYQNPWRDQWMIATDGTNCTLGLVTQVAQPGGGAYPPAQPLTGYVTLTYTRKFGASWVYPPGTSRVIHLGTEMTRTRYSIDPAKLQLYSTDDNPGLAAAASPVPIAQNVVLLKAQYGVDTNNDQIVDCWTSAIAGGACGLDYSDTAFKVTPAPASMRALIRSVKAVRIAVVVRSDELAKPETIDPAEKIGIKLKNQTAWLFNCAANNATCQGRMQITSAVMQDYTRYRIYETVIPFRNSLWNPP